MSLRLSNNGSRTDNGNATLSSKAIKAGAHNLGFFACGVAKAGPVSETTARAFRQWIADHKHASMAYMADNMEKRLDPTLLLPGARSIICVAMSYKPRRRLPDNEPQIAAYALGKDYHDIMKERLHMLAASLGISEYRAFTDTAPVLERYWAEQAALGWIGRNRQLITPGGGSMVFLGELLIKQQAEYDTPITARCRQCNACIDACPTHALTLNGIDANLCLSYHTIESRQAIPDGIASAMGNHIYGCDRCQDACPWNSKAPFATEPLLQPSEALLGMDRDKWKQLTIEQYRALFKGSAVKRAKYDGLMRNIKAWEDAQEGQLQSNRIKEK